MEEKREIEDRKKQVVKGAHLVVAGEEAEGTTARDAENTFDGCGGRGDEFGVARVGHGWREIKQCLLTVLEVRRDNELACVGKAETAAEMLKAALDGERGGGEDDSGDLVEDEISKKLGDVNGRCLKEGTASTTAGTTPWRGILDSGCAGGSAPLKPEDHVGGFGLEHKFEVGAEGGSAVFEAGSFIEIGDAVELGFDERERRANGKIEVTRGFEEFFAIGEGMAAIGGHGEGGEEETRALAKLLGKCGNLRGGGVAAEKNVGIAGKIFEAQIGERAAEVLRGDLFKLVGLIEDDGGGFGEDAGVGRIAGREADRRVCKEEMVIDDDEVGLEGAAAHLGDEAAPIVGAC